MIKPENDLPHMESGKLILLLFAKIWIDHFIFRIKKFEVDKSPPGLLLHWLITNKQDPPTYRAGKREESGCETCAVKCIVHPHTTEGRFFLNFSLHWNILRLSFTFWNRDWNNPKDGEGSSHTKKVGHFEVFHLVLTFSVLFYNFDLLIFSGITEVILKPAVDTTSKKDLLARLSERHPNASYQKKEVSTGIPGFKFFFVSCLVDGSKTSGRIY